MKIKPVWKAKKCGTLIKHRLSTGTLTKNNIMSVKNFVRVVIQNKKGELLVIFEKK
jgi:hypothetical protein